MVTEVAKAMGMRAAETVAVDTMAQVTAVMRVMVVSQEVAVASAVVATVGVAVVAVVVAAMEAAVMAAEDWPVPGTRGQQAPRSSLSEMGQATTASLRCRDALHTR